MKTSNQRRIVIQKGWIRMLTVYVRNCEFQAEAVGLRFVAGRSPSEIGFAEGF